MDQFNFPDRRTRPGSQMPIVGVLANASMDGRLHVQSVDKKYIDALKAVSDVAVIIIPAIAACKGENSVILECLDGLVLTGAISNVHPQYFDPHADEICHSPFDHGRDKSAFDLIRQAMDRDMPLFAICRGMQEFNVSRGGSLVPQIDLDTRRFCHEAWDKGAPLNQLYEPVHAVRVKPDGMLFDIAGATTVRVNSLHVQAIDRLGDGLVVEGVAEDGTIEAISDPEKQFALGVQWHPEFQAIDNELSRRLFHAFGAAARTFRMYKNQYQGVSYAN